MVSICIDEKALTPKYKQIVEAILLEIEKGVLMKGTMLPSINQLSEEYYLSRDTVEKAYKELRGNGIITSVRGKGYFINTSEAYPKPGIFLHFNKISTYKKTVYNAFVNAIGGFGRVDIFVHHNNLQLFENQLLSNLGKYNNYVVIPPDVEDKEFVNKLLKKIPFRKLLLLDKLPEGFDNVSAVYQNFETDIFEALASGVDLLSKYNKLILVFPLTRGYAKEITSGFMRFCTSHSFKFDIVSDFDLDKVNKGEAYIVIEDEDLVKLLKIIGAKHLVTGTEVGIISYNDVPLKEILAEGITVISTDFEAMGKSAAEILIGNKHKVLKNPFHLIRRKSL